MAFPTDTSFLWVSSMVEPDFGLAVVSSLFAFCIPNLSAVGVAGDLRKRENFIRESENFFFSPTGFIMTLGNGRNKIISYSLSYVFNLQINFNLRTAHMLPENRNKVMNDSFRNLIVKPVPGRGQILASSFILSGFSYYWMSQIPAIVPFYVCSYLLVRIVFEHLFFTKVGRRIFGFDPNLDLQSEKSPLKSIWNRFVNGGRLNATDLNPHYLEIYPLNIKVSL